MDMSRAMLKVLIEQCLDLADEATKGEEVDLNHNIEACASLSGSLLDRAIADIDPVELRKLILEGTNDF